MRVAALLTMCLTGAVLFAWEAPDRQARTTRKSLLVAYPQGSSVKVKLQGTMRLPGANGEAEVRRRPGATGIRIKLDRMKPAILFGGDFSTYVLWTVSPEGIAMNTGELVLDGDRSKLEVSTPLTVFGMFVTAEPHYLVKVPSRFVVLDNTDVGLIRGRVTTSTVEYTCFDAVYRFDRETLLREPATEGTFPVDRQQAQSAVSLAERAGARKFASQELNKAYRALSAMTEAFAGGVNDQRVGFLARETVRLAVGAEELARQRGRQARIDAALQEQQQRIGRLTKARQEADAAALQARKEADEARKQQQELRKAKAEAERAARIAGEERLNARQIMRQAQEESAKLVLLRRQALDDADRARRDAEESRRRMQLALSRVAETRETARGFIVSLPDILFDSGRASLRPKAREVLSRVAGILLVAPECPISIEGHTDSVGSEESNHRLSEQRARSVRDYLVEAQIPAALITTKGFGESLPVARNSTPQGRQRNRRVELVIADAWVTAPSSSSY